MFSSQRLGRLTIRLGLISLMTIALVLSSGTIAHGQLPTLPLNDLDDRFSQWRLRNDSQPASPWFCRGE